MNTQRESFYALHPHYSPTKSHPLNSIYERMNVVGCNYLQNQHYNTAALHLAEGQIMICSATKQMHDDGLF